MRKLKPKKNANKKAIPAKPKLAFLKNNFQRL